MNQHNQINIDEDTFSPLHLLYTAYTDKRPMVNQIMEEGFQILGKYLAPLSREDQNAVFLTFCEIYTENERLAFLAGVRAGVRLAAELTE